MRGDSKLVLSQVKSEWKCEKPHLKPLCTRCQELVRTFRECSLLHVLRAQNAEADALANRAMDSKTNFENCIGGGGVGGKDVRRERSSSPLRELGKRARDAAVDEPAAQRARIDADRPLAGVQVYFVPGASLTGPRSTLLRNIASGLGAHICNCASQLRAGGDSSFVVASSSLAESKLLKALVS